jgi:hypothetical protein
VKARAKEEGIVLPKADHWTWYEDDYSRGLQRLTRKKLGDRGLVTFEVSTKQKAITKFESLDESLFTFSDAIRVEEILVTVGDLRKKPPFRLTKPDAHRLCRRLTAGLKLRKDLSRSLYRAPGGFVEAEELRQLLAASA